MLVFKSISEESRAWQILWKLLNRLCDLLLPANEPPFLVINEHSVYTQ